MGGHLPYAGYSGHASWIKGRLIEWALRRLYRIGEGSERVGEGWLRTACEDRTEPDGVLVRTRPHRLRKHRCRTRARVQMKPEPPEERV